MIYFTSTLLSFLRYSFSIFYKLLSFIGYINQEFHERDEKKSKNSTQRKKDIYIRVQSEEKYKNRQNWDCQSILSKQINDKNFCKIIKRLKVQNIQTEKNKNWAKLCIMPSEVNDDYYQVYLILLKCPVTFGH